jgi:GT2 family glycosyltransferase
MEQKRFGGFIMTYQRAAVLKSTIAQIFEQSVTPEKLLIVDNSDDDETKQMVLSLRDSRLIYHRVGYNAGPAGAAKIGLEKLTDEGYHWIYWGDDDDPPTFKNSFEALLKILNEDSGKKLGVVGVVGQRFNRSSAMIVRVSDAQLLDTETTDVDSIAGNQCMIVNAAVVKAGILPDEKLFFGFEELDFCLRVKEKGFDIRVSSALFVLSRKKYNRIGYVKPLYVTKALGDLTREYYSTRNLLVILARHKLYRAWALVLLKNTIKSVYGFRYGIKYGTKNFKFLIKGMLHGILKKSGRLHSLPS